MRGRPFSPSHAILRAALSIGLGVVLLAVAEARRLVKAQDDDENRAQSFHLRLACVGGGAGVASRGLARVPVHLGQPRFAWVNSKAMAESREAVPLN